MQRRPLDSRAPGCTSFFAFWGRAQKGHKAVDVMGTTHDQDTENTPATVEEDTTLPPVRGLVLTHNAKGEPFTLTDLKKWVRLNNTIFKAEKVDLGLNGNDAGFVQELLEWAQHEHLALSPRVGAGLRPEQLGLNDAPPPFHDVFLAPAQTNMPWLARWTEACRRARCDVRVQVIPPFDTGLDDLAERLAQAHSVNIAFDDPFVASPKAETQGEAMRRLRQMEALASRVHARGVETSLLAVPFCRMEPQHWRRLYNRPQFFLDHAHYQKPAYEFAEQMLQCGPAWVGKAIENQLAREISVHNSIDRALFPWIIQHPKVYVRTWMVHKLTRHLRRLQPQPRPLGDNVTAAEAEVEKHIAREAKKLPKPCRQCRLRRLCDHDNAAWRQAAPAVGVETQPGDTVVNPLHFVRENTPRHYDSIDSTRRQFSEHARTLAAEAERIVMREPHTREITSDSYAIEHHFTHHMPGAVRWLAFTPAEYRSTVLTRVEPPFTMSLTFGGGIAEYIGFAFGRTARIMCPMIDFSHRLTLHVDPAGHYVLLRDGVLVRPAEFEGERRLPTRLAGCLEPRIAMRNIDGFVLTQTMLLWEHGQNAQEDLQRITYSVIIINSRYARRLQAALLSLAHQTGFNLDNVEVVIGYVPGIDTTDDLIESMQRTHPELRIVRAPFSEDCARSKGFMINEAVQVASGNWLVLLDADILLPPDFFCRVDAATGDTHFIAPDGRKMLSPETTAHILLGEIRPWECHEELAQAKGDYRFREAARVPIGFCQCVRRDVFDTVRYHELDHFEGSDWLFGHDVVNFVAPEKRIEGMVVLHLDHGGSQWYGTKKHL
ncbi:MAG: glycosyltransferase family 2 protein [Candidatus Hydrogenedentota bacterium]